MSQTIFCCLALMFLVAFGVFVVLDRIGVAERRILAALKEDSDEQ